MRINYPRVQLLDAYVHVRIWMKHARGNIAKNIDLLHCFYKFHQKEMTMEKNFEPENLEEKVTAAKLPCSLIED